MCGSILCVAVLAFGIDAGWQPLPDGGLEYIIQIEPHLLGQLQPDTEIISDIDPEAKGVRSVRIRVGTDDLPRRALPAPAGNSRTLPEDSPVLGQTGPILDPFRLPGHLSGRNETTRHPNQSLVPVEPRSRSAATVTSNHVPNPLSLDPRTRPIDGQTTAYQQETPKVPPSEVLPSEVSPSGNGRGEQEIPPWAWIATLGALAASTGAMLYLGWVAWDYRSRYRRLLDRLFEGNRQPWLEDNIEETSTSH